ncbi:hypothetical protein FBU30_001374 [Linnemannia zychae]|nr:hypothetical protein FBU30_001374 [Linnemannia zychae]
MFDERMPEFEEEYEEQMQKMRKTMDGSQHTPTTLNTGDNSNGVSTKRDYTVSNSVAQRAFSCAAFSQEHETPLRGEFIFSRSAGNTLKTSGLGVYCYTPGCTQGGSNLGALQDTTEGSFGAHHHLSYQAYQPYRKK